MMAEDSDKIMSPSAEDNAKEQLGTEEAEIQPNANAGPEQSLSDSGHRVLLGQFFTIFSFWLFMFDDFRGYLRFCML